MWRSSYPKQTSSQCKALVVLSSKTKAADKSANTFSERVRAGPVFLFGKYKGTFKTHAECQAFIDGVTAVVDDNRRSRSEASS
ncbi:hypothetical protein ACVWWO_001912 [Bradyrhizobium sp. F1.13.1]